MQLKDLPVGSKIKFGTYQVENSSVKSIIWQVAGINHYKDINNPDIVDHVTLVPEKIIDLRGFDAKEPNNSNSDRRSYGSNRYLHSNIRQWLNKSGYDWFEKQHNADEPPTDSGMSQPTGYDNIPGFLSNFTEEELNSIISTKLIVAKNTVTDGGGSEIVEDLIFLLSNTEVGLANENNIVEGSRLSLFTADNLSRTRPATDDCVNYTKSSFKPSLNANWYWWLRTPNSTYSGNVRLVGTGGSLNFSSAYDGNHGVFPALNLKSEILVSETDGIYDLTFNNPPQLSDVIISKTNIWVEDEGVINVICRVDDEDGEDIQYKLLVNEEEVVPLTELQSTPASLNIQVPVNEFDVGDNLLELVVLDERGGETVLEYNIIKEDRDTFIFKRRFDFKESYITDPNIEVSNGLALKEMGAGEVVVEIPTEGKSRIKSIEVDSVEIEEQAVEITDEMTYVNDMGAGKVYEVPFKKYKNILGIEVG